MVNVEYLAVTTGGTYRNRCTINFSVCYPLGFQCLVVRWKREFSGIFACVVGYSAWWEPAIGLSHVPGNVTCDVPRIAIHKTLCW